MKATKSILSVILLAVIIFAGGLWFVKGQVETAAQNRLAGYTNNGNEQNDLDTTLMNATRYAHAESKNITSSAKPWFAKIQCIATSKYVPGALRTSTSAFDIAYPADNEKAANQLLVYILEQQGIDVEMWDIVSPHATKQAVIVKVDNGASYKYLDPIDGVVALYENKLILGPYAARLLISSGADYRSLFLKLNEDADLSFYKDFEGAMFAPPGYPLYINVAAPVLEESLVLGEVDGKGDDVAEAATKWELTRYFDYLGAKHGGHVLRRMYFTQAAKVSLTLVEDVDMKVVTTNIEPKVEGRTLVFEIPEDEALVFDGNTEVLDRKPGDFISVDQIIIERL